MRIRTRRYHTGGGIPPHKHPHPGDVLEPLVSESTQPVGYTEPVDPFSEPINIIPRPDTLSSISDEEWEKSNQPISWLELFSDPMRAFRFYNQNQQFNAAANLPGYEGRFEPFRRPTKAEFEATGGRAMDFAGQVFNPATYMQTAVELDQDLTELDKTIIAAFEDGNLSGSDLDRVAGQLSDAGLKTLFLLGGASMLRGSGIGSLKVPASDVSKGRAVFGRNLGEAADDFIGSGVQQQTGTLGPLQQLARSNVPVAASNVPVAASEAGLFGNKFTFKGLKDFFLPKPELTIQSGQLSLSNKMTDAMLTGEKFASQYYLNANTLDRLGQLYGPIGTGQLYDLGLNKTFDNIARNLKAKDFSYTPPGGQITYSGDELQGYIKKLYTERAIWATSGVESSPGPGMGANLFPFELSKMTSPGGGGGRLQGSYGTYANRHFPGVLVSRVGGMGRSEPFSTAIQFTPAEILTTYAKQPFGVHPDDFKQSLIDTYGPVKGLEKYENVGGLRYEVNNAAGNLTRIYGIRSFPERVIDPETGLKVDPSRSMGSLVQEQYDNAVRTVVHEMNHYYFGMANLPNELIVPWMQYLTDEANVHLFSKYPKGKIQWDGPESVRYYAQPVEIQARTGELRYQMVKQILKNKGITLSKDTSAYDINKAIDELEIIIKRGDEDAFNKIFGGQNGEVANSIRVPFRNIIKGNNFEEKRKSFMELMKIVPVVGGSLVVGGTLDEDLPILGYKDGGALKFLTKKYGAGGTVEEFGAQGNFETEYKSRLPEVEEPSDPNEELLATTDPEIEEPTLTEEEIKALKKKKALGAAGKGAALGASIGSAVPGIGTVIGAAAGALIGGIGSLVANKGLEDQPELIMARNGVKVHKKQRTFDEGGLLEALRERRAKRRVGRTTIQPNNPEYLEGSAGMFNQYLIGEVQGIPRRSIVLDPEYGDESVLTHELIHSTQYGPLQQIAAELRFENAGRIQDKDSRKAFKKLFRSLDPKTQTFNRMGEYMVGGKEQDIEFDAIIKSAISSAKKRGYDLSGKTYSEILDTLSKARDEGNISLNMKHLGNFMNTDKETGNTWTDKQKGYIMDAIKANLDFEGYTAEDVKQDLR